MAFVHTLFEYSKHPTPPPSHFPVGKNVGYEATAFLSFIIDNYDALPAAMVFLHGHRYSYHSEDLLILVPILEERVHPGWEGYCNLNNAVWGHREDPERESLRRHWGEWIGEYLGEMGEEGAKVFDRCCAQFVVSRDR